MVVVIGHTTDLLRREYTAEIKVVTNYYMRNQIRN